MITWYLMTISWLVKYPISWSWWTVYIFLILHESCSIYICNVLLFTMNWFVYFKIRVSLYLNQTRPIIFSIVLASWGDEGGLEGGVECIHSFRLFHSLLYYIYNTISCLSLPVAWHYLTNLQWMTGSIIYIQLINANARFGRVQWLIWWLQIVLLLFLEFPKIDWVELTPNWGQRYRMTSNPRVHIR